MMVCAAAREIADGERVFVGMRLPLLAFLVALGTHAPHAVGLFENGVVRTSPAEAPFITMGDPPNVQGALMCGPMKLTRSFTKQFLAYGVKDKDIIFEDFEFF